MSLNKSGILPRGLSVLVLPEQVKEKTETGIILHTPAELEREQLKQTDGVVIAIGPLAYYDEKDADGNVVPRCQVGDRVIMTAYAGMIRKGVDGLRYRLIRDADVIGVLAEKEEVENV